MRRFGYIRASRHRGRGKWRSDLVRPGWPTLVAKLRGETPYPYSLSPGPAENLPPPIARTLSPSITEGIPSDVPATEQPVAHETPQVVVEDRPYIAAPDPGETAPEALAARAPLDEPDSSSRFLAMVERALRGEATAVQLESELRQIEWDLDLPANDGQRDRSSISFAEGQLFREIEFVRNDGTPAEREWLAKLGEGSEPALSWIAERGIEIEAAASGRDLLEASVLVELRHAIRARERRRLLEVVSSVTIDHAAVERIAERDGIGFGAEKKVRYLDGLKATAQILAVHRSNEADAAGKAAYWQRVSDELRALAASGPLPKLAAPKPAAPKPAAPKPPAVPRWSAPSVVLIEPGPPPEPETIDELIEAKTRQARARGMSACFPSPAGRSVEELRQQLRDATSRQAAGLLMEQFRAILPAEYKQVKAKTRANPEFSEIVSAVRAHAMKGHRLMLVPRRHPGVALIDVRRAPGEFLAQWGDCIRAAASEEGASIIAADLAKVAALRVGVKVVDVTDALDKVGLHVIIGATTPDA